MSTPNYNYGSNVGPTKDQVGQFLDDKQRKEAIERQKKQDEQDRKRREDASKPKPSSKPY